MVFDDATADALRIRMEVIEQHTNPWEGPRPISATGTFTFLMPDGSSTSYPLAYNNIGNSEKLVLDIIVESTEDLFLKAYIFSAAISATRKSGVPTATLRKEIKMETIRCTDTSERAYGMFRCSSLDWHAEVL
ncbi:MAG: hypothetical protein V1800_17160 [Candidatus Latescibacterota bacterium]